MIIDTRGSYAAFKQFVLGLTANYSVASDGSGEIWVVNSDTVTRCSFSSLPASFSSDFPGAVQFAVAPVFS